MNNNQDSQKPIIPFKPQIENNQEELIAKAEEIIAPKKPKVKIILTTLVAFLLLGSVAGAVYLVRQNQNPQKNAQEVVRPAGCCDGPCSDLGCGGCASNEKCDISNGACAESGSAYSCRSVTGCLHDTDCGPGNACVNGQCQTGTNGNPRSASQVCTDEGGSTTSTCTADPTCGSNGGTCCDKSGTNYCCYGDSANRKDGACYAGGASGVSCSGNTITNNTRNPITISHFTKNPGANNYTCPLTAAGGSNTSLAPGQSASANGCEQIDAVGFCGVCNDSQCNPPQAPTMPPANPTVTPTPALSCSCDLIKAYSPTWTLLTSADLSALKAGDKVRFAAKGTTSSGTIDKIRYKINNGAYLESTIKKPGTNEFYYEYTIPANTTSFSVSAEVHQKETDKWFD